MYRDLVCNILTRTDWMFPLTDFTFSGLATELAEGIPFVGSYLIYDAFSLLFSVATIVLGYKLIKIFPVKL